MKNSKLNRFDQAFLTVFGSIGTIVPLFQPCQKELAKERLTGKNSK